MPEKKPATLSFCFFLPLFLIFSSCADLPSTANSSGGSGASLADSQAMAQAALDRMNGGGQPSSGQAPSAQQLASAPAQQQSAVSTSTGSRPAWVDSADSVYSRSQYVAIVGSASDRAMAERSALANLTAYFGQSIQADRTITSAYQEAVRNGVTSSWSDNTAVDETIRTSASMDTLVGAEIRGVWYDSRSTYYAVAVLEKARAAQVYRDLIIANQNMIRNLLAMSQSEKNSLEGYSRYQFAAAVADINTTYGNLLRLIDAPLPQGMVTGNEYRLEAQNITRAIPVGVVVDYDKSGRIQGAFAKAISDLGFRSGPANSRYVIRVGVSVSPVDLPANPNKFVRIELSANLTDTAGGAVLLPWNFNSREGHASESEAENRAFLTAERRINSDYADILRAYLSQLLPVK